MELYGFLAALNALGVVSSVFCAVETENREALSLWLLVALLNALLLAGNVAALVRN